MNCPACGQRLQWEDGAFCSTCMEIAEEKIHMDEWTHIADTEPKARKAYRCTLCERQIARGTKHVKRFGYDSEGPVTARMHTRCEVLTHDWGEDEWITMGAREFRQEYLAGEFLLSLLPEVAHSNG